LNESFNRKSGNISFLISDAELNGRFGLLGLCTANQTHHSTQRCKWEKICDQILE